MLPTMNLKQYVSFSKLFLFCAVLLLNPVHSLGASQDTFPDSLASKQGYVTGNALVSEVSPSQTTPSVREEVQEKQSSSSSGLVYVLLIIQILWILLSIFVYLEKIRPIRKVETSGSDSAKRSQGSVTKAQETQKKQKNSQVEKLEKKITELKNEINRLDKAIETLEKRVREPEQRPDTKQDGNTDDPKSPPQTSSAQVAPAPTGETTSAVISMQEPHTSEPMYLYIGRIPASTSDINLDSSKPSPCYFQVKVTANGEAELSLCDDYRSVGEKGGIENNLRGCGLIKIEGGGNGSSFELVNWGTGTIQNNRFKMDTPIKYKRKG